MKQGNWLSLQKHYQLSERSIVVGGTALVTINDRVRSFETDAKDGNDRCHMIQAPTVGENDFNQNEHFRKSK